MSDRYSIEIVCETEGDSPRIYVVERESGDWAIEVFEEPKLAKGKTWSWDPEAWRPGPLAKRILGMLNRADEEEEQP